MKRLTRTVFMVLMILLSLSCAHPITGEKTDPWRALWYSLYAPDSSTKAIAEYRQNSYYHLYHHYDRVIAQQADPKFASTPKVND